MGLNELADRLENLSQRIELAHVEQDSKTVICSLNDLNQEVWKSREAILKALRFAADMERLVQAGCEPGLETQVDNPDNPDDPERCVVRWWNGRHWQFSYGVDYYTAARNAVEALEKGE